MRSAFIYTAVALAAALGGFLIYRTFMAPAPDPAITTPPIEIADEPPAELPEFALADRDGELRSIRSWPGRSMIVNFWATWCAPCREEIPLLIEVQREHGSEGFQVVGVAVDFRDAVLEYAEEMGINYPILIGEEDGLEAVNAFGLSAVGFPFTAFTADDGRIVTLHLGAISAAEMDFILEAVRQVNRAALTIPEARTELAERLAELDAAG